MHSMLCKCLDPVNIFNGMSLIHPGAQPCTPSLRTRPEREHPPWPGRRQSRGLSRGPSLR